MTLLLAPLPVVCILKPKDYDDFNNQGTHHNRHARLHHATANTIDDPLSKERESHISEYSTETNGSSRTATDNGPSSGAYKTHGGAQVTEICNDSRPIKPIT